MGSNRKERSEFILRTAEEIVGGFGVEKLDGMPLKEANALKVLFKHQVARLADCHLETARRNVAKACRRLRHPDRREPGRGGKREGAGRKPAPPSLYESLTAGMSDKNAQAFVLCPMFIGGDSVDIETFVEEVYRQPVTDENYREVAQEFRRWYRENYPSEYHPPPAQPFDL
jgi:hypothetical protein